MFRSLLEECDTIVAEVTQPSLGVGYEIGRGVAMGGRRILCLYRPQPEKRELQSVTASACICPLTMLSYRIARWWLPWFEPRRRSLALHSAGMTRGRWQRSFLTVRTRASLQSDSSILL